jgi:HK97 family phage major capsid protein
MVVPVVLISRQRPYRPARILAMARVLSRHPLRPGPYPEELPVPAAHLAALSDLAREVEELALDLSDLTGDPASAKAAFARFVVHGDGLLHRTERKVLSVGSDPGGGFWYPAQLASQILGIVRETSGLVARCLPATVPEGTSSWSTNLLTSGCEAEWLTEVQAPTASTTNRFGAVNVELQTVSVLLWASRKWVEDATDAVEVLTRDAAEAIGLTLEQGVIDGSGTHAEPYGTAARPCTVGCTRSTLTAGAAWPRPSAAIGSRS